MPGAVCAEAGRTCRHKAQRLASTRIRKGRDMGYKSSDDKIKRRRAKKNRARAIDEQVRSWDEENALGGVAR